MDLFIDNKSGAPIYDQIYNQIKDQIIQGALQPDEAMPSIRGLARDLRISVITTKRAYDGKRFGNFTHFKDGVDDAQKVRGFAGACVVFTFAAAGTPAIGAYDEPAARNQSFGHGGDDFVIFAAALRGDRMRQKGDALGADIGKINVEFDKAGFTGGLCSMRSGHFSKAVHFLI